MVIEEGGEFETGGWRMARKENWRISDWRLYDLDIVFAEVVVVCYKAF